MPSSSKISLQWTPQTVADDTASYLLGSKQRGVSFQVMETHLVDGFMTTPRTRTRALSAAFRIGFLVVSHHDVNVLMVDTGYTSVKGTFYLDDMIMSGCEG